MSLYNTLFGENPMADSLLKIVGLDRNQIPRYRDCRLSEDKTKVIVFTRTGGGNRECFCETPLTILHEEGCYAFLNERMTQNPNYLSDHDDDFDSTYAYWEFKIPDPFLVKDLEIEDNRPVGNKFKHLIEQMQSNPNSPEAKRAFEIGKQMLDPILKDMEKK